MDWEREAMNQIQEDKESYNLQQEERKNALRTLKQQASLHMINTDGTEVDKTNQKDNQKDQLTSNLTYSNTPTTNQYQNRNDNANIIVVNNYQGQGPKN